MKEIIEKINAKRKRDINGYITALVLDLLLWVVSLTAGLEKFITLGAVFVPIALVIGLCLRAELKIYKHPEMNLIYKSLSHIGTKEEIDRYVDQQLLTPIIDNEFFKITPELVFNKRFIFNVFLVKNIKDFSMNPTSPNLERQIVIYINSQERKSIIPTILKANEENITKINGIVWEANQKLLELKNNQNY